MLRISRISTNEVRQRAAEVRGNWSATERRRREGLPPDIPTKLRNYLQDWRTSECGHARGDAI